MQPVQMFMLIMCSLTCQKSFAVLSTMKTGLTFDPHQAPSLQIIDIGYTKFFRYQKNLIDISNH